ncbi:hypothetical protein HPB51_023743 [Rhipicephalus microplus]|uniref:Uncharacterized protein n=1 Tax=Rhipicephalus microplus TaxID=6941 RepID=A0A9J6EJY5_RHIMP|nr:hypothetical protein HPB51_023743 [Rhipicephalus microplus]
MTTADRFDEDGGPEKRRTALSTNELSDDSLPASRQCLDSGIRGDAVPAESNLRARVAKSAFKTRNVSFERHQQKVRAHTRRLVERLQKRARMRKDSGSGRSPGKWDSAITGRGQTGSLFRVARWSTQWKRRRKRFAITPRDPASYKQRGCVPASRCTDREECSNSTRGGGCRLSAAGVANELAWRRRRVEYTLYEETAAMVSFRHSLQLTSSTPVLAKGPNIVRISNLGSNARRRPLTRWRIREGSGGRRAWRSERTRLPNATPFCGGAAIVDRRRQVVAGGGGP